MKLLKTSEFIEWCADNTPFPISNEDYFFLFVKYANWINQPLLKHHFIKEKDKPHYFKGFDLSNNSIILINETFNNVFKITDDNKIQTSGLFEDFNIPTIESLVSSFDFSINIELTEECREYLFGSL